MVLIGLLCSLLCGALTTAQQYQGDTIPNSLPAVDGAEVTYFRITDPANAQNNLTLINYYSHGSSGQRLDNSKIQRLVVTIHGSNRDAWNYEAHTLSALAGQTSNTNCNKDTVAVLAPMFANEEDAKTAYPVNADGSSSSDALVWSGFQWSDGGNTHSPSFATATSSYTVLDQIIQYYNDQSIFPNMKQIVIAGHSRGAQTSVRYAALSRLGTTRVPVSYYVGNPNGYAWFTSDRPLSTTSCPTYDNYGDGYAAFTNYPMTYGADLVASGRENILSNFRSKNIAFARGLQDMGDASETCGPSTTGANRNDRFFNFIKAFPVSCSSPSSQTCQTIDYVDAGHDDTAMFSSPAGIARLFLDNFNGDGSRAFDFGYPRHQDGDDPYPDPSQAKK